MRNAAALFRACLAAIPCFVPLATANASVIVVSGGDFALNVAVQAAADGDTLLVHAGSYFFFEVNGKSLSILAYPGETVSVTSSNPPSARVRNLPLGKTCVVSGIRAYSLEVADCLGSVRIAGMRSGAGGIECFAQIDNSGDVSLTTCAFRGKTNPGPIPGGTGLTILNSNVALYDTSSSGANGVSLPDVFGVVFGTPGGDGVSVGGSSSVFASNCSWSGGNGGNGSAPNPTCHPGGAGGDGLVANASMPVQLLATTTSGGIGGLGCGSLSANGSPSVGAVTNVAGARRALEAPAPVREGSPYSLTVRGEPGDRVILVTSARTRWSFEPLFSGVVLYGPGVRRHPMGMIGASGVLTANFTAPTLPAGVDATLLHMQAICVDTNGSPRLSGPVTEVFFGSSF